jgi:hypothetical protein
MLLVSVFAFFYLLFKYRHAPQNISAFNIFPIECLSVFNIHTSRNVRISQYPIFWADVYVGKMYSNIQKKLSTVMLPYLLIQYPQFQLFAVYIGPQKNLENKINKLFVSLKTRAKQERAITW